MPGSNDSLELIRKDHTLLASSVSVLTTEVGVLKVDKAVEAERDKHLQERLTRIEKSIESLHGIGRWLLMAFFGAIIAGLVTFMFKGGFSVPPTP